MTIEAGIPLGFFYALAYNGAQFGIDTFKIALYTEEASLTRQTTDITTQEDYEATGSGYTAGGKTITTNVAFNLNDEGEYNNREFISIHFGTATWTNLTTSFRYAAVYRTSDDLPIAFVDFGETQNPSNQTVSIVWPTPSPQLNASIVIRTKPI